MELDPGAAGSRLDESISTAMPCIIASIVRTTRSPVLLRTKVPVNPGERSGLDPDCFSQNE